MRKLYTTINEFKNAMNNYELLIHDDTGGALLKNDNKYYYFTYDHYNDKIFEPYLNDMRVDDDEERITHYRDIKFSEDPNADDVVEAYVNDKQPTIIYDYNEIDENDVLYYINTIEKFNLVLDQFKDSLKELFNKYKNEII